MDLQKEYEKLYQHWLNEFQNIDLTAIDQEDFNGYKKILEFINEYQEESKDDLKDQILKSYKDNLNYLFKDLLEIREMKIINSALAIKEINLNNLTEAEKLLYENLVSSIKGYKKLKATSLYEEDEHKFIEEAPISREVKTSKIQESIKKADKDKVKYVLVRFLKKTPPLVGVDLVNYGPFEEEDLANLPYKNAKILIIERFAEKIDIN